MIQKYGKRTEKMERRKQQEQFIVTVIEPATHEDGIYSVSADSIFKIFPPSAEDSEEALQAISNKYQMTYEYKKSEKVFVFKSANFE